MKDLLINHGVRFKIIRILIVCFMVFCIFIASFPLPTLAQSRDRGEDRISQLGNNENFETFAGPDPDAIYVRLSVGQYQSTTPPARETTTPDNSISQPGRESVIQMDGFGLSQSYGDPMLPYQIYHLALPPDADTSTLRWEITNINEMELRGTYNITPAPLPLFDLEYPYQDDLGYQYYGLDTGKKIVNGYNMLIYEDDSFYPDQYCQVKPGGQLRKWKVATVTYHPILYNPVQAKLIIAEEIVIKINFDRDSSYLQLTRTKKLLQDSTFDDQARDLFMNYDEVIGDYLRPLYDGTISNGGAIVEIKDPNFAIITTEEIYTNSNTLDDFCFHKQDLGFTVIVVTEYNTHTVDGTFGNYNFIDASGGYEDLVGDAPNHRPEKIRQWLIDNYLDLGIEYVLLIGNPDPDNLEDDDLIGDLPMRTCSEAPGLELPTDLYYSDLSGDWNLDDDYYVCERIPETDPDLGYSISTIPDNINVDQFCVRWEGVVAVDGPDGNLPIIFRFKTDGQMKVWLDDDNQGFLNDDVIYDHPNEHYILYNVRTEYLTNGYYPILIEYTQSGEDAYGKVYATGHMTFMHDDGTGNYVEGLEADYFNNNDFSGEPDVEQVDIQPDAQYIIGGDIGDGGVDFYPEVIVGRIPFYGEDENGDGNPDYNILDGILTKTINYENAYNDEEAWRQRVLFSAPYLGGTYSNYKIGEVIKDNLAPPPFWEWYRIHEEDFPDVEPDAEVNTGCTSEAFINGWNDPDDPEDGRGVVMWNTHGSPFSAGFVIEEDQVSELDDSKPSIVLQASCNNGLPEVRPDDDYPYPLGYSLLRNGAIATISGSRSTEGGDYFPSYLNNNHKENPYMLYFISEGIFANNKVGEALANYREYDATLGEFWSNILGYNLYGDPTISLFGPEPEVVVNNDIVFLIDGSSSMLLEEKWDTTVDATILFYELIKELRYPEFEDRYNCVVFRHKIPDISTAPFYDILMDFSTSLSPYPFSQVAPEMGYLTPMGAGLEMAIGYLDETSPDEFTRKTILLLSDGIHNWGTHPLDVDIPDDIKVQTVGLGLDTIQPDVIQEIAESSDADFRITPSPIEIVDFFLQILCDTSDNLQNIPVILSDTNYDLIDDTASVTIDKNKAIFVVAWNDQDASINFQLDPPGDGPNITPITDSTAYPTMEITYHAPSTDSTHAFYLCNNIPSELFGEWKFVQINDGGLAVPFSDVLLKVVEDPQVIADFDIDNLETVVGQPIVLSAKLTEDNLPMTDLAEIYAELIRSPSDSIGTILSQNLAVTSSIIQFGGPKIILRDDGTAGDLKADDGVYTGLFTNTTYEGSYTFEFRAKGDNSDGFAFDRAETLSKYVKFAASPNRTKIEILSIENNTQRESLNISYRITPIDKYGSYLGPSRGRLLGVMSSPKALRINYTDNNDGSYNISLSYPIKTEPNITFSIGNRIIVEKTIPIKRPETPAEITKGIIEDLEQIELPSGTPQWVTRFYERALNNLQDAYEEFENNDNSSALSALSSGVLMLVLIEDRVTGISDILQHILDLTDDIVSARIETASAEADTRLDKVRVILAENFFENSHRQAESGREYLAIVSYRIAYGFADKV